MTPTPHRCHSDSNGDKDANTFHVRDTFTDINPICVCYTNNDTDTITIVDPNRDIEW